MSVSTDVSYFSRFLLKFIEIIAAGLATAVSGYLIAHLSGALSSSAPTPAAAVNQVTPSIGLPSVLPPQPVPLDTTKQPSALQHTNASPVVQSGQAMADTKKSEGPRKHVENATSPPESNHQRTSLLARVRAALANVDAKRRDPLDEVAPHPAEVIQPAAAMPQPQPVTAPAVITNPPISTVEVPSQPVAEPRARSTTEMSPLEQRLRQDPLIGTADPPRPPMPVAE